MLNLFTILLLGLFAALALICYQFVFLPSRNPLRNLPAPPTRTRIFGSHLGSVLHGEKSARVHEELVNRYGRNIRIKGVGFWDDRLLSLDPVAITHVLNNPSRYQKPWQSRRLITRLLGCGMLAAEGIVHKRQRKVSTPAFSPSNLKKFLPLFVEKADELVHKWIDMDSSGSEVIDVWHWISRATFDVIGLAGFGYSFNAIQDESNEVYLAYKEMFEVAVSQGSDLKTILGIYFPWIWRIFPDESSRAVDKSWQVILKVGRALVRTKKLKIIQGETDQKDLLSLMLKSNLSDGIPIEQRISDDDLLFQISTFLFAGSDTTSLALTWGLHILSRPEYQHFQDRLREELEQLDSSGSAHNFFSELDGLPFLDNVVKEVLRLVPPVHSSIRVATTDDVIPTSGPVKMLTGVLTNGIPIAKGTMVHVPIEGFALDRGIWGLDAWHFNPDRWDSLPPGVNDQPGAFANLLTFSGGPRACIGMRFSVMEMKIMLHKLVTNFKYINAEPIFKANVVLTRPYISGRFKEGSQCPIQVKRIIRKS